MTMAEPPPCHQMPPLALFRELRRCQNLAGSADWKEVSPTIRAIIPARYDDSDDSKSDRVGFVLLRRAKKNVDNKMVCRYSAG